MIRRTKEVTLDRIGKPHDVIWSSNPFDKHDRVPVNAVLHKASSGYRLVSLNKSNLPIQCWRTSYGISAMKSFVVSEDRIKALIESIDPKILYLNDGTLIQPIRRNVCVYFDKSLPELLDEIKIDLEKAAIAVTNTSKEDVISFKDMKLLDPKITRKEYSNFIKSYMSTRTSA